jgi:hypothetical protein
VSRDLVRENFRYVNGLVARNELVRVVFRGTNTLVTLYVAESGFYDFLALGARIPFDVEPDVEIGQQDLDSVVDRLESELGETNLVLLWENAKAGA